MSEDEAVDEDRDGTDAEDGELECEVCGARVPAAIYVEHLLKACPGSSE